MSQSTQLQDMAENGSPYRLGKVAIAVVFLLAALSSAPAIISGSVGIGIGTFVGTLITGFIVVSILKFVFVAGKRTLLQQNDEDVEQAS